MTWKIAVKDQVKLQMEITNYCNAACPACARDHVNDTFKDKERITPYTWSVNTSYLDLETFKSWLDKDNWSSLEKIFFCGNYDEPATNPDLLPICEWIIQNEKLFPTLPHISLSTNGGTRNEQFWEDLGKLSKKSGRLRVNFAIDGFEDTNHLYRVNVKWERLQKNWRAYIKAGGHAWWQWVQFEHNEHQKHLVQPYAKKEGFLKVKFIGSWRPAKKGITSVKDQKAEANKSFTKVVPDCYRNKTESMGLYVGHNGVVSPCCWIGTKAAIGDVYKYNKGDYTEGILNGTNSIQDILDSQWMKTFRGNMEAGVFPKCLQKCKENINNTYRYEELK